MILLFFFFFFFFFFLSFLFNFLDYIINFALSNNLFCILLVRLDCGSLVVNLAMGSWASVF